MVIDRAIRGTSPAPSVPVSALWGEARSVVQRVASGSLDRHLSPLRRAEMRGQRRPSVVQAIDHRTRLILGVL
jgi:hypothetical protein